MLDPQVVVNLLPELGVGVDLVRCGHWLDETFKCDLGRIVQIASSVSALCSETNELHKQPFIWVDCSKSARNKRGTILALVDPGLHSDLAIALSGASAKVKPPSQL